MNDERRAIVAAGIRAKVIVVCRSFGVAYAEASDGKHYAINLGTDGIYFGALTEGDELHCDVSRFGYVVRASLVTGSNQPGQPGSTYGVTG